MGAGKSSELHKKSSARQVVEVFGGENPNTCLAGKVAVVTGGNSGIGTETVKALVSAGCKVFLGCRQVASGHKAVKEVIEVDGAAGYSVPNGASLIEVVRLDLEDLDSIHEFADQVLKESRLDLLVLNAGVMAIPELSRTTSGWEKQIGTNHFGHFYLTKLLRDKMVAQPTPSRIVAVASEAHRMGGLDIEDLHYESRSYGAWTAYAQSKLCNILFAKQLADDLVGTQVTAVSLHPGVILTNLFSANYWPGFEDTFLGRAVGGIIFDKTVPQGASTTLYGCLAPDLDKEPGRGAYLMDCAIGTPTAQGADADKTLRKALWVATEEQLKKALEGEQSVAPQRVGTVDRGLSGPH